MQVNIVNSFVGYIFMNISHSQTHGYQHQTLKKTRKETILEEYTMNEDTIPRVDTAMRLGKIRPNYMKRNIIANIEERI